MELKRIIPVLGHQQWNISSRAAAKDSFAQRIMRKYVPADEYGLPSVSFVHYQPFLQEDDREKLVQLAQVLMAFNRFSALSIKHSYEIRYYSMLKTQCEQLFSSLHMNPFPHPALKELHLVYSTLLSRYGHVISREEPGIREWIQRIGTSGAFQNVQGKNARISGVDIREKPEKKNLGQREGGQDWEEEGESHSSKEAEREWDQERQEQIEQELIQIQEQIGHVAAFLNPSKNIALPTRRLDSGTRFNWKSEQAKQFFWRVQRASVSEQELILSALNLHSLSGLMDQLKRVNEEQWTGVSRQIQERIWLFLEDREAISWISSGKGWFRQTARREIETGAEKAIRYLHLMDTGWYQSVMEAVSYLNLEEWQELKRETLSWISVKRGKEPTVADSLAKRQEEHRTFIDSLAKRQEEHRTAIDSLTERQEEHNMSVLQMSEEKQMLFEQLNRQKEELQEILQAGGPGAGDLPGRNVSSAELLENILSVRQRFQESRVLSKYLNQEEEERLHSFREILRQMPEPEWSRLQEELFVIQEMDLYWNLRQGSSDPGKKMEEEAEEAANQTADQGSLQRIDKQTAAQYLYFMDAGWYPSVMEAVSQLNLEEWQELKRETLSWISANHGEELAAADSSTRRQEEHHTAIESLAEKQEEHNMAVLQMSEEKQMLFEQLNQQKEELQEILQAGGSGAGDLPGRNVSSAKLLENILSVRQRFQESQVLSKYLNWEKEEEERLHSFQEILRQMPDPEWSQLQEELSVIREKDLYWDLRQGIPSPEKEMEKGTEEPANQRADQGTLQRIDKQTAARYLYFMDAGWYPSVMEAVSQLNLEEWQELKQETLSWISVKHGREAAAVDSLTEKQEGHRTAIDSLMERQEGHRTAIDSLTERQKEHRTAIDSLIERQEEHHTAIESLTEKQEEHNMSVLQMSEEKQMLFEQLNQQKEELQEILQAGEAGAGDLSGRNVSLAELLENILFVRQRFRESRVLSKYLNWEKEEEEWIDSLQEILRQMPESEWGRLQEEWSITQGKDLYWDLRQSILNRKRTEFVSLLMELRQDIGKTEDGDGAAARPFDEQQPAISGTAGILIPMVEEGIRRTVIRKEKADWYQSMMEAISYLDTEEWNTLKAEMISAAPASFAFPSDPLPVWEEKQALIFALEKRKEEISAIPHMSQPDEGKASEAWERAMKNSQVLSSYIEQRQTEIFDKPSEESRTESFHVQEKTDLIFRKESVKQSLLGMDEENWNYFCREMQTLFEENPRQIETNTAVSKKTLINREERLLEEHRTVRSVDEREETALLHWLREHNEGTILFPPLRNVREKLSRMPVLSGEWMGKEPGIQAALQVMEEHRERRMVLREPVFSREQLSIQEEAVLRRESSSQEEQALRGEMAFREDAPLQEMASSQRNIPVYDPASMVTAKGQSGRADSSQALPPQIRREVQTQVTRQVEEQTDIQFITRVRNAEQQGASREELEQMEKQLARQKQELEQLKQQQSLPAGPDAGQLSKTVLKKLQNQLRQEQLRHGR